MSNCKVVYLGNNNQSVRLEANGQRPWLQKMMHPVFCRQIFWLWP